MLQEAKEVLQWAKTPVLWLSGRANRKRLSGARVEVIGVIMCARPTPSVLMARSVYNDCWMPPQEGVNVGESFRSALVRGLSEECRISLCDQNGKINPQFYLRNIEYVDTLWLPPERWGERAVAANIEDSPLSHILLKKKAYWAAYVIVNATRNISFRPNGTEVSELAWMDFDQAYTEVRRNRQEKASMLTDCLERGMQHLVGVRRADNWYAPD